MPKRSRTDANLGGSPNGRSSSDIIGPGGPGPSPTSITVAPPSGRPLLAGEARNGDLVSLQQQLPLISRKVKACASCRKQKVRCHMDESGPPCRRCMEKDLNCVLNKSLQTLISERLPSNDLMLQDMESLHAGLQTVLRTLNLPPIRPLQSPRFAAGGAPTPRSAEASELHPHEEEDDGPSCDNSPKPSPDDRDLHNVPIHYVYHLTKLRALRASESSDEANHTNDQHDGHDALQPDDIISQGLIALEDAERLFNLYTSRLDHFMYGIGGQYALLSTLRHKSPILTAAILTVAAMHDPRGNRIYPICHREFRRLMTTSLFDRRVDRDHLRALCIASYWLNDASWILSGVASRRADEANIMNHFNALLSAGDSEDAADFVRIYYIIYICDHHLSTLYGRPPVRREDAAISGWETLIQRRGSTVGDKRLVSQVALLIIIHNVRELLGPDTNKPVPAVFATQIKGFARQLDQWVGHWTTVFPAEVQESFGLFPRKLALFHFHFAKLYLYSHVFRGLRNSPVEPHFSDEANGAVHAATSILNMIITDPVVKGALVGLPCYIQSMIGFACMFLAKLTSIPGGPIIESFVVIDRISRLLSVYQSTPVGKWHLVHLMADGLEKILNILQLPTGVPTAGPNSLHAETNQRLGETPDLSDPNGLGQFDMMMNLESQFMMGPGLAMGSSEQLFLGGDFFGFNEQNGAM